MDIIRKAFARLYVLQAELRNEDGQGFTEYAVLLTVVIAIGLAVVVTGIGTTIGSKLSSIITSIPV